MCLFSLSVCGKSKMYVVMKGCVLRRQHIMLMCYALVVLESNAPQRQINNVNNEL